MKPTFSLLLSIFFLVLISSCQSEEERKMALMVDSLDSAWAIHEAKASAFYHSVDEMKKSVKPVQILGAGEESLLSGESAIAWEELRDRTFGGLALGSGGKLSTADPFVLGENAFVILYDDSLWNSSINAFFRNLNGLSSLHLSHLYDHMQDDEWSTLFMSETHISIDGQKRPEFRDNSLELMPKLGKIQYLLVAQPVLLIPGKEQQGSFEGGSALANVRLWDIKAQKFSGNFWAKAVNSLSVMSFTYGNQTKKEAIEAELKDDLRRNLHKDLRGDLTRVINNATSKLKK